MTKRYILPLILIVIIAAGAIFLWHKRALAPAALPTTIASSTPAEQTSIRDQVWKVFEAYLAAAKAHDIAALSASAYKLSAACQNQATKNDCYSRMDTVYNFGKDIKESDLPNITGDSKQVFLYTNYNEHLDGDNPSITRGLLLFARASDGTWRLASIQPFQGSFLMRDSLPKNTPTSTINSMLKDLTVDSDGDLLPDRTETCTDTSIDQCVKTDPHKKDTDGDGWWDSIEPFVKN